MSSITHNKKTPFDVGTPQHDKLVLLAMIERRAREIAEGQYRLIMEQMLNDPAITSGALLANAASGEACQYPVFETTEALSRHRAAVDILGLIIQSAREHIRTEVKRLQNDPEVSWSSNPGPTVSIFTTLV